MIMTLSNRRTLTETCHSATSSIINLTRAGPRRHSGLRGEKPVTNRRSHGSASVWCRDPPGGHDQMSLNCIFSLGGALSNSRSGLSCHTSLSLLIYIFTYKLTHLTHPELCTMHPICSAFVSPCLVQLTSLCCITM